MDYIAEIKELAKKGHSIGVMKNPNRRKRLFEPTATMKQIQDFERDMCVTLPRPFVRYLTELGNGGAGADYGIYSLDRMREENPHAALAKDLPPMLDHSLTDAQWTEFAQRYTEICQRNFSSPEEGEQAEKALREMELQMMAGGIIISTSGCTMNTILMCRGEAKGEVFVLDWDYMFQVHSEPWCGGKFEDWMINNMRQRIKNPDVLSIITDLSPKAPSKAVSSKYFHTIFRVIKIVGFLCSLFLLFFSLLRILRP